MNSGDCDSVIDGDSQLSNDDHTNSPDDHSDQGEFEVRDIVGYRYAGNRYEYLTRWHNHPNEISFLSKENFSNGNEILADAIARRESKELPFYRSTDDYRYKHGLSEEELARAGEAGVPADNSGSGGASSNSNSDDASKSEDESHSCSSDSGGASDSERVSDSGSDISSDDDDNRKGAGSVNEIVRRLGRVDSVRRQFGNNQVVRAYRCLRASVKRNPRLRKQMAKELDKISAEDEREMSLSDALALIGEKGDRGRRKTSRVYKAFVDSIRDSDGFMAHEGNESPKGEKVTETCQMLLKKLGVLRDRSLRIPQTRAEMLKLNEQAIALYRIAEGLEVRSFKKLKVWHLVRRPIGKNVMKVRWVYDHKFDGQGKLIRMKGRIVAKGFTQVYGHDYTETFSPTVRFKTFIMLCTLKASSGGKMKTDLWDVSTAFLNADADTEMYCEQPAGWEVPGKPRRQWVYKLDKTIYGTKQAGRNWHIHLKGILSEIGFVQSQADECLFTLRKDGTYMHILVHVDDMAVFYEGDDLHAYVFNEINKRVVCQSDGGLNMFLGVRIIHNVDGSIELSQEHYIDTLAERFGQLERDWVGVNLPYASSVRLTSAMRPQNEEERARALTLPYQELVGGLNYLRITRPELTYSMSQLGKWMSNWGIRHWKAGLQHLRYAIKTKSKTLVVRPIRGKPIIKMWVDSDFFGDRDPGQKDVGASHGGYAAMICGDEDSKMFTGNVVSVHSKKHNVITLSSMEAEIREATTGTKEIIYLRALLGDLGYRQTSPSVMYEDNSGCISFSKNATHHENTKHVVLRYFWLK